jgi:multidrug transporter EmrE-like cation transporter
MSVSELLALTGVEIIGDFAFKEFSNNGGLLPFTIGSAGYIGVVYFLIRSLQNSSVLIVNGAWDGFSALFETFAAYIFLGERFDHIGQYFGIVFIIIGLFLLRIPMKKEKPFKWPEIFEK